MKKILVAISILLLCIPVLNLNVSAVYENNSDTKFLSEYVQTLYNEGSEIPVSQVKSVLQTSDGYIWIAGYQGLIRYNGMDTKQFGVDDGFPTNNVNVLYEDSKKRLWIGTNDKGIVLYEKGSFTVYDIDTGLVSASVRDIAEDMNGNIYAATTNGVGCIAEDGLLHVLDAFQNKFIIRMSLTADGNLICVSNIGEVFIYNGTDIIKTFTNIDIGTNNQILSVTSSDNGLLYFGTSGNEVIVTEKNLFVQRVIETGSLQNILRFNKDKSNRVWMCADNGVGYIEDNVYHAVNGLMMDNSFECVFEDYEGSYWIGSSRHGLLQLTKSKLKNVSFNANLPDCTVNTTAVWNNVLYVGADTGLFILRNNTVVENELTELLNGIRIRNMLVDSNNQLWICTYEKYGVITVKSDGSYSYLNADDGLANNKVRCIIETSDGYIIAGMSGGISIIRDGIIVRSYTSHDGLSNDVILSLCENGKGSFLAGSDGGGIYEINNNGIVRNYTEKDGLSAGIILRITKIDDIYWISTGNNICVMDNSGIRTIEKLSPYSDNVFDIIEVDDKIWMLHTNGLNIYDKNNLLSKDPLIANVLEKKDGLSATITPNSWNAMDEDGTLYFGTGKYVLSFNKENLINNNPKSLSGISEVVVDGMPVNIKNGEFIIGSDAKRINFHIDLLSFSSKEGTITYNLKGFDNEYITTDRSDTQWVSYTNLKGGKYTLYVYGTNSDGKISDVSLVTFTKEYQFFEIPFVRLILILLVLAIVILITERVVLRKIRSAKSKKQEFKEIAGEFIHALVELADSRCDNNSGHAKRMAEYAKMIGVRLGLAKDEIEAIYYSTLLHDIGNVGMSDDVLKLCGKKITDDAQRELFMAHTQVGSELLSHLNIWGDITSGAECHHENFDGTGYPKGLSGDEIPLAARIIKVCDFFDSMICQGKDIENVQSALIYRAGVEFDEKITAVLISLINEGVVPI